MAQPLCKNVKSFPQAGLPSNSWGDPNYQRPPKLIIFVPEIRKRTQYKETSVARHSDWNFSQKTHRAVQYQNPEDILRWINNAITYVTTTAQYTTQLITNIKALMERYKEIIRAEQPKIYRHELLNNLFDHPYTKIEFVMEDLQVSRLTASKYLDNLVSMDLLKKKNSVAQTTTLTTHCWIYSLIKNKE